MEQIRVKAKMTNFQQCLAFVEEQLEKKCFDQGAKLKIIVACEEIIANVINYAYSDGEGDLIIAFNSDLDSVIITFIDNGKPFNPFAEPEVDISLPAEERDVGGLGILMIRNLMDHVSYDYQNNQNILTITKKLTNS